MLLLGIDLGTSGIKVSVVAADSGRVVAQARYPETEVPIKTAQPGWAEQSPDEWWQHVQGAIRLVVASGLFDPQAVAAIGIAYQMHGLVLTDKEGRVLRDAIIWCDSRAVPYGNAAFEAIGPEQCLSAYLNAPGNFTAAKLAWVKDQEPAIYEQAAQVLLPGDFIAYRLTGSCTTTAAALSEGIFWDFSKERVADGIMRYFGFEDSLIPEVRPVFSEHGFLEAAVAQSLGLKPGIPVSYKAGDQPNNALSLNVLQPGEVAATAGTSGVIYGVADTLAYDPGSRVNSFAHVNHNPEEKRIGVLLCINGTGILNRWIRDTMCAQTPYEVLNAEAAQVPAGAQGLMVLPFGNGAERMLHNRIVGAHFHGLDLNVHGRAHLVRAAQEGIAFAFRYGLDIMRSNGMQPSVIRAGKANMFLSPVFTEAFVNATGVPVELYPCDGSVGAAMGAGIGAGIYAQESEAFRNMQPLQTIYPDSRRQCYEDLYSQWHHLLQQQL